MDFLLLISHGLKLIRFAFGSFPGSFKMKFIKRDFVQPIEVSTLYLFGGVLCSNFFKSVSNNLMSPFHFMISKWQFWWEEVGCIFQPKHINVFHSNGMLASSFAAVTKEHFVTFERLTMRGQTVSKYWEYDSTLPGWNCNNLMTNLVREF